jgi:broad specificity phosphatase PhoE
VRLVHFITHPEVDVDPAVPVPEWRLSVVGEARMRRCLAQPWLARVGHLFASRERKARDGARILSAHLGLPWTEDEELGENDRSATGFLPPDEFQRTADVFFAHPERSVRGWETARAAQARVVRAVGRAIASVQGTASIAIVSHGGVGTLLLCHLAGAPITRARDQPGRGGGCVFAFDADTRRVLHDWQTIDEPFPVP